MERQSNPPRFSDLREALLNEGHAYLFRYNKSLRCQGSSDSQPPKVAVILENAVSLPQSKGSCLPSPAYLAKLTSLHLVCSSSTLVRVAFQVGWLIYPRFSTNIKEFDDFKPNAMPLSFQNSWLLEKDGILFEFRDCRSLKRCSWNRKAFMLTLTEKSLAFFIALWIHRTVVDQNLWCLILYGDN